MTGSYRWICVLFEGFVFSFFLTPSFAQTYKELPPAGIEISADVRQELQTRLVGLREKLSQATASSDDSDTWRVDVEVIFRAVDLALQQRLFFKKSQVADARDLLDEASRRIDAAANGDRGLILLGFDSEKADQPQPLIGGFVSRIDDSIQPYGLVVPAGYSPSSTDRSYRLDVWLHGRGDTKTEIPFLKERSAKPGQYTPAETFVLHPFGRHCNAFKFAGETDVYESMSHVKKLAKIDDNRVCIRGFSMGGAGCWHLTVHDPARWLASNPGAGFVDTIVYQGWKDRTPFEITPTAKKLLNWYDVLPWVQNLSETNVVAYSGEVDKQKRAADRVVRPGHAIGNRISLRHRKGDGTQDRSPFGLHDR